MGCVNKSNGVSDQCISWGPKARLTVGYRCQIGDVLLLLFNMMMMMMMMTTMMMIMLMMMLMMPIGHILREKFKTSRKFDKLRKVDKIKKN